MSPEPQHLRACLLVLAASFAAGLWPNAAAAADQTPVIVHLADGTTLPLRDWSLSYEYVAWPSGSSQALAAAARRQSRDLWIARRPISTAGLLLELEHDMVPRDPGEGGSGPPEIPTVRRLRLTWPGGRNQAIKVEPPHRELLVPAGTKSLNVVPRSLDLHGQTLAGTRRELCVLSYTSLVECGVERAGRVVKLEFPGRE